MSDRALMREYYFMITLQWPVDQGFHTSERRGTIRIPANRSRLDATEGLIRDIAAQVGAPVDFVVMFLLLEPNELAS